MALLFCSVSLTAHLAHALFSLLLFVFILLLADLWHVIENMLINHGSSLFQNHNGARHHQASCNLRRMNVQALERHLAPSGLDIVWPLTVDRYNATVMINARPPILLTITAAAAF